MKRLLPVIAVMNFILLSCSRQNSTDSIPATFQGSWRMTAVKDNGSGVITVPNDSQGNVDLSFIVTTDSSGTFSGHTPSNDISQSDYIAGPNQQLTIPFLDMTKVGENAWGSQFVDNILSSQQYSFESENKLIITTTDKTLTFQRQ